LISNNTSELPVNLISCDIEDTLVNPETILSIIENTDLDVNQTLRLQNEEVQENV